MGWIKTLEMKIKTWFFISEVTSSGGSSKEFFESGIPDHSGKVLCICQWKKRSMMKDVTKTIYSQKCDIPAYKLYNLNQL